MGLGKTSPDNHLGREPNTILSLETMLITRNQASSTNEGRKILCRDYSVLQPFSRRATTSNHDSVQRLKKDTVKRRSPLWRQPFSTEIDETPIPPNFREIVIESYNGTQDPHAHLQAFQRKMYISDGNDRLNCKLFPGTLRGVAMHWMATLPARSIQTFSDLFAANKVKRLEVSNLFDIKQAREESLKSYLARFNNAPIRVDDPDQKFFIKASKKGLRAGSFSGTLALRKPARMTRRFHAPRMPLLYGCIIAELFASSCKRI
ncbi:hypothetical protein CR513_62147, partial [Mucuna pruriens]